MPPHKWVKFWLKNTFHISRKFSKFLFPLLIKMTPEQEDFINQSNNTPKDFSHNKLQLELDELRKSQSELNDTLSEKDMQIKLQRTTIESLQSESKNKSLDVQRLESVIEEKNTIHSDTLQLLETAKSKELQLSESCSNLKNELHSLQNELSNLKEEKINLHRDNTNISFELSQLKEKLDNHVSTATSDKSIVEETQSKLDALQTVHNKTCNELETLKLELAEYKLNLSNKDTQIKNISLELEETENQLKLHLQHQAGEASSVLGRSRRHGGTRRR
jgi:chromosome segregation ATPase